MEQAQNYYNTIKAKIQKETAQQEFENWLKRQQLANDTAKTQYDINKPYSNSNTKQFSMNLSQAKEELDILNTKTEQRERIFQLEQAGYITSEKAKQLWSDYKLEEE